MSLHLQQDSYLVALYIDGSEKALEILIKRHQSRIFGFIYKKVQNKSVAEDVFQDTFIKVIRTLKKGNYNEKGKFLPWVMRIAHNLIIDYFRKNSRMPKFNNTDEFDIFSVLFNDSELNIDAKMVKEQIITDIQNLIEELPEDQKEVLKMRIYMDMSFNEISENIDVSINTALGRMRYALINLRKIIKKHNISLTHS